MNNEQLFEKIFSECDNLTKLRESKDELIEDDDIFDDALYEFQHDENSEKAF
jgi:hypothetical protein